MEEQILKLCKRVNKFTLENLEILSEVPKTELLPILSKFVDENKLIKQENEYIFQKNKVPVQKYSIFKTYPAIINDIVLRCFCENINSIKASNIANIGEDPNSKNLYNIQNFDLPKAKTKFRFLLSKILHKKHVIESFLIKKYIYTCTAIKFLYLKIF